MGSRHVVANDFIHFGNKEVEYKHYVHPLIAALDLNDIINKLMAKVGRGKINEQGNVQIGGDFATQNHKLDIDTVTAPQPTVRVDLFLVSQMVTMTAIFRSLAESIPSFDISAVISSSKNVQPGKALRRQFS
jgi:hypothetical protein